MSLFSFGKKTDTDQPKAGRTGSGESDEATQKEVATPAAEKKRPQDSPVIKTADVLLRPLFTEKAVEMEQDRKYVFEVDTRATKPEVRKAVERAYDVSVTKIAIINERPKMRRWRGRFGTTPGMKKAIVTLAEGQSIEIVSH